MSDRLRVVVFSRPSFLAASFHIEPLFIARLSVGTTNSSRKIMLELPEHL